MKRTTATGVLLAMCLSALVIIGSLSTAAAELRHPGPKQDGQGILHAATPKPDLTIISIQFQVVKNQLSASGKQCQIYNLYATVHNQGNADAGAFDVLIERNKGMNWAFELACQACVIPVAGLAKGNSLKLDARQFNNCGNNWNSFKVTADPKAGFALAGKVKESNENNNSMTKDYGAKESTPQDKAPAAQEKK